MFKVFLGKNYPGLIQPDFLIINFNYSKMYFFYYCLHITKDLN